MRSLREIPGIEIFKVSPYSRIISAQDKVPAKSIHYHI